MREDVDAEFEGGEMRKPRLSKVKLAAVPGYVSEAFC
jgi:hypothetical protein